MRIGMVKGTVVSTQKAESLIGYKLLIVQQIDSAGNIIGKDEVAVDILSAGIGERVLLCSGSSARAFLENTKSPIDLAVVGIIDSLEN